MSAGCVGPEPHNSQCVAQTSLASLPEGCDDSVRNVPRLFPGNNFKIMPAAPKAIREHLPRPLPVIVHDSLRQPLG